ncbi:MAG: hypothetical protein ABIM16_03235, partial [Ginsengibacter sp.]
VESALKKLSNLFEYGHQASSGLEVSLKLYCVFVKLIRPIMPTTGCPDEAKEKQVNKIENNKIFIKKFIICNF